jgi:hypothetical protein
MVLTKGTNPSTWNMDDLKNMVKWFMLPLGPVLPTHRQEFIDRYEQTKIRAAIGTILPYAAPMPAASVPALQAPPNPMPTLGLASLTNPMALDLASAIVLSVLAPATASYIAPDVAADVAADVAPAAAAGVTLTVATGKEKENKKNGHEMLDDEFLIVDDRK